MKLKLLTLIMLGLPLTLFAYVGPGAGISFLGALWAVISAVLLAIGGFLVWPIRAFLRKRKLKKQNTKSADNK